MQTAMLNVLHDAGLRVDGIAFDGVLHRCPVDGKPHGQDGAYIAHLDPPSSIWWQNWRTGQGGSWTAKEQQHLTPAEREALSQRIEGAKKTRAEEQARRHSEAASKAHCIYQAAVDCISHDYLTAKGVKPVPGLKVSRQPDKYPALIIPVYNQVGAVMSLQFIQPDGTKRFLSGGQKKDCFFPIGKDASKPLVICEGLATGLSIHEATGLPILAAFDAGNMRHVAEMARDKYPQRETLIAADNDHEPMENN